MSISWLQRKRKGDLLELAQEAQMPDADGLLKDDLVDALFSHLEGNETTFAKKPAFRDFYQRSGSPIKRERASPSDLAVIKSRSRRQTLKGPDSDEPTSEKTLIARTPRTVSRIPSRISQVDMPASPAQLAEVADQSFQVAKTKAAEVWQKSRIEEAIETIRENASSVVFIQLAVLFIEGAGLEWNTLQWAHAFDSPASAALNLPSKQVHLPDLRILLTSDFWAPATLWSLTSWTLPLLFSYFFNLTRRSNTHHKSASKQYTVDPLTFNIARALLAYSAYYVASIPAAELAGETGTAHAQNLGWGPFSEPTVRTVRDNVPWGYTGLNVGSVVGILVTLYDAALKK